MMDENMIQSAIELKNVINVIGKIRMEKEKQGELKPAEKHMFFIISNCYQGEEVKPSELARTLGVSLSAVSHHLNALEKYGYIERVQDLNDKRISRIKLSEKGREYDTKLKKEFFEMVLKLVQFLGEEDSKELIRLMGRVSEFMKTH